MAHIAGHEPCPECKIVINNGRIAANATVLADAVEKHFAKGNKLDSKAAEKIIKLLNDAEDCVDKATTTFLRAQGYDGPVNKALED